MTRRTLLHKLEALLNHDEGELSGTESLEDLPDWDSLAILSVIALFDKELGFVIKPAVVLKCKTIDEVMDLVANRLAP